MSRENEIGLSKREKKKGGEGGKSETEEDRERERKKPCLLFFQLICSNISSEASFLKKK